MKTGQSAIKLAPTPPVDGAPGVHVVARRCCVCEWHDRAVEVPGADPDCPWCHGPTVVDDIDGESPPTDHREKNPHAAALGRLGGIKGGPARAAVLTAKRRHEIAVKAARARWRRHR